MILSITAVLSDLIRLAAGLPLRILSPHHRERAQKKEKKKSHLACDEHARLSTIQEPFLALGFSPANVRPRLTDHLRRFPRTRTWRSKIQSNRRKYQIIISSGTRGQCEPAQQARVHLLPTLGLDLYGAAGFVPTYRLQPKSCIPR